MKKSILILILSFILIFSLNSSFATDLTNDSIELTLENSVNDNIITVDDISNSQGDIHLENNLEGDCPISVSDS